MFVQISQFSKEVQSSSKAKKKSRKKYILLYGSRRQAMQRMAVTRLILTVALMVYHCRGHLNGKVFRRLPSYRLEQVTVFRETPISQFHIISCNSITFCYYTTYLHKKLGNIRHKKKKKRNSVKQMIPLFDFSFLLFMFQHFIE